MEAIMVDRTAAAAAEITTLRQELAAAKTRIQEMGRHNATEADKDKRVQAVRVVEVAHSNVRRSA
jgi:hypothetical protein